MSLWLISKGNVLERVLGYVKASQGSWREITQLLFIRRQFIKIYSHMQAILLDFWKFYDGKPDASTLVFTTRFLCRFFSNINTEVKSVFLSRLIKELSQFFLEISQKFPTFFHKIVDQDQPINILQ